MIKVCIKSLFNMTINKKTSSTEFNRNLLNDDKLFFKNLI